MLNVCLIINETKICVEQTRSQGGGQKGAVSRAVPAKSKCPLANGSRLQKNFWLAICQCKDS
jgi:hypothetical protein